MAANRRLAKKVLTYDELAQIIENDEDMDAFLPPLDNNEDTDVESENEEDFPESQLLVESNRNVKSNLNDEIENENDSCEIPKFTDDVHDHSVEVHESGEAVNELILTSAEEQVLRQWNKIEKATEIPTYVKPNYVWEENYFEECQNSLYIFIKFLGNVPEDITFQSNL
ncbi:uncharacterized protein [Diabrotica undecimpunctata]|uniref:uncharacterized protein n=1 Tax=Diabrotica undecimpunctata TaxID=50387 RepID=UPI003B634119